MKTKPVFLFLTVAFFAILNACQKDDQPNHPASEEFRTNLPTGWKVNVITHDYGPRDTIWGYHSVPEFVLQFINPNHTFKDYTNTLVHPELKLNFFTIDHKQDLLDLIVAQKDFPWCITWYYGETEDYFIVTSPCYINHGHLGGTEAEEVLKLDQALKSILTVNDYFGPCE
jgi:hypothetical protein